MKTIDRMGRGALVALLTLALVALLLGCEPVAAQDYDQTWSAPNMDHGACVIDVRGRKPKVVCSSAALKPKAKGLRYVGSPLKGSWLANGLMLVWVPVVLLFAVSWFGGLLGLGRRP